MPNKADFQEQVLSLLARLKTKKATLQHDYELRIAEVDREIESVSTTARLLREPAATIEVRVADRLQVADYGLITTQLIGKSAREALLIIAKATGGSIRVSDVKPMLLNAGVIKNTKHAWGAIYTTLTRSREFEKVPDEQGAFRLVDTGSQVKLPVAS